MPFRTSEMGVVKTRRGSRGERAGVGEDDGYRAMKISHARRREHRMTGMVESRAIGKDVRFQSFHADRFIGIL